MAAPMKPWEMTAGRTRVAEESSPARQLLNGLASPAMPAAGVGGRAAPPALPPRPLASSSAALSPYAGAGYGLGGYGGSYGGYGGYGGGGYGGYGGGFGGGYGGGLGGYGGFGSYGSPYGGGFNRFPGGAGGMYGDVESRFIQLAEESSRPTFQSIESIVGAVGSVAMMLENTFFAMTSSFRAILGVAENFGRLRSLFAQFWSAFAVVRTFNWLIKKLLVLLGIRTENEFRAWAEAQKACAETNGPAPNAPKASSWPAILFLGVIGAVPYIIVKMLGTITNTLQGNVSDPATWQNPIQALSQYDFQASTPQELGFGANEIVTIAPQSVQGNLWNSGWLMATVDGKRSGLVPVNYFKFIRDNAVLTNQSTAQNGPIDGPNLNANIGDDHQNTPNTTD